MGGNSMIIITAKCILKDNKKEEFIKVAQEMIEETNKEVGCISYDLYEDINDENIVTFIEEWESREAIERHNNSEHVKRIVPVFNELRVEKPTINLYEKVEAR